MVTSYTTLAREYFRKLDLKLGLIDEHGEGNGTHVDYVGGSVEAACALGLADGIGKQSRVLVGYTSYLWSLSAT